MTSLLITGATGTLGAVLSPRLEGHFDVVRAAQRTKVPGVRLCDLTDQTATRALLNETNPETIIHLAALTDVDLCERDAAKAEAIHVGATESLADWITQASPQTRLIYVSTDQVYDAPGPSFENQGAPRNVYAATKLQGEDQARRCLRHSVLRVNFVAGRTAGGKGLITWLVAKAQGDTPAVLFKDVLFNPLHVEHLAALIVEIVEREIGGTLNLGAAGPGMSKAQFLRSAAARLELPVRNFRDGSVVDAKLAAYRPRDMRMDVSKAEAMLGHELPTIGDGLDRLADEYARAAA